MNNYVIVDGSSRATTWRIRQWYFQTL